MAKEIAWVLGAKKKSGIRWEGRDSSGREVWVSWCIGHLVGIAPPDAHDPKWKTWKPHVLPILPKTLKWEVNKKTKSHFNTLKTLIQDQRVSEIVNACDAGREGELIFRTVYQKARGKAPVLRFWVSSLTPSAIRHGLNTLKPSKDFDPLGAAAYCRAHADWIVGMNGTRALTSRAQDLLSIGRVQTPTLAMLVKRDQEITQFKSEPYWIVEALLETQAGEEWVAKWIGDDSNKTTQSGSPSPKMTQKESKEAKPGSEQNKQKGRIFNRNHAQEIINQVGGKIGEVVKSEGKNEKVSPPQLYHLTALQQEANRRYGFSADDTLKFAQSLYEKHKLLSYPRTDSRYLTPDLISEIPKILKILPPPYQSPAQQILHHGLPRLNKRYVNAQKVADHHAILPTDKSPNLSTLDRGERHIYDLVVRSLLMALFPVAIDAVTEIEAVIAHHRWWAKGKVEIEPGWRVLKPSSPSKSKEKSESKRLPRLQIGTPVRAKATRIVDKETQPPKPYTEATLLGAMEHAGKKMDDQELKEALKGNGLGTPATRASIMEMLLRRKYIQRKGKQLQPTETGICLINGIHSPELVSPTLTAQWEKALHDIAEGIGDPHHFETQLYQWTHEFIQHLLSGPVIQLPTSSRHRGQRQNRSKAQTYSSKNQGALSASSSNTTSSWRTQTQKKEKKKYSKIPNQIIGMTCPKCKQGQVIQGQRAWGCSRWNQNCSFVIPFFFNGVPIDEAEAIRVIHSGKSRLFHEQDGKKWRLKLNLKKPSFLQWEANQPRSKKGSKGTKTGSSKSNEVGIQRWKKKTKKKKER